MNQVTRIIAIRHGETSWNVETRVQGQLDIDLNEKGRWQARQAGLALADTGIDHIYSSDLKRALDTAIAIGNEIEKATGKAPDITKNIGLRERGFGSFEGLTYEEIELGWPEESRRWKTRDPNFAPAGGETPLQLHARVADTVDLIASRHLGQCIVLVAHGGVMDQIYRIATHQDLSTPRTWELGNAAINRLLWTPEGLSLVGWADTLHLSESSLDETST